MNGSGIARPPGRTARARWQGHEEAGRWYASRPLLGGILALGVALRLVQYFANRPLWWDEAMLTMNILSRSYAGLLQRLDSTQVAPTGFLLIERFAVTTLGSSELALRLFPLLAGIASLFLFLTVARRSLPAAAVPLALFLFAVSDRLIYYSSEVKQYSSDVAVALTLVLLGFWVREKTVTPARAAVLGVAGGMALWISQPAAFVLAGVGASLLILYGRERRWAELRGLLLSFGLWALVGIPALLLAMRSASGQTGVLMDEYWRSGFMPFPPRSLAEALWLPKASRRLFASTLGIWPSVGLLLAAAGCFWALRARRDTLLLLLTPLLFALLAAALQLYPFGGAAVGLRPFHPGRGRILLFLVPFMLLLVAAGAEFLRKQLRGRRVAVLYVLLALLVYPHFRALAGSFPYEREDVRSLVEHIRESWQPGDRIWVYPYIQRQFLYYSREYPDLHAAHQLMRPEQEVEFGRTGRVWTLLAYADVEGASHHQAVVAYLDSLATRCREMASYGAFLYLYERPAPTQRALPLARPGCTPAPPAVHAAPVPAAARPVELR